MSDQHTDIAIVGGGASGVLLAGELVRQQRGQLRITLIDRGPQIGLGVAYSTACADHLLNVRADNMSALADDPDHFVRWLIAEGYEYGRGEFVPRMIYGRYLRALLAEAEAMAGGALRTLVGEVVDANPVGDALQLTLEDSPAITARSVVLATGHRPPASDRGAYMGDPWCREALEDLDSSASVLLIGTSLTMVDVVLSLLEVGHTGSILAISRRGLLPRVHPAIQEKNPGCDAGALFTGPLSARLAKFRDAVDCGTSWEDLMQKLRPRNAELWNSLDFDEKSRFLRHLRPWWDVHRHRLATRVGEAIEGAIASGQLSIMAGRVQSMEIGARHVRAALQARGTGATTAHDFHRVVDCSGPRNSAQGGPSLQGQLMRKGLLSNDPLGLGIEVDHHDAAIGAGGSAPALFAFGPPTRGRHWEINAVPDIRERAAQLASHLAGLFAEDRQPAVRSKAG